MCNAPVGPMHALHIRCRTSERNCAIIYKRAKRNASGCDYCSRRIGIVERSVVKLSVIINESFKDD